MEENPNLENTNNKQKKKQSGITTAALILVFLVGLGLILYPSVSDYWNNLHQSRAISSYSEIVAKVDNTEYEKLLEEAREFNEYLINRPHSWELTEEEKEKYYSVLDISGTGIMGYVTIDKIGVKAPIYHGTDESVLQIAIGHMEASSFPIGGPGTHAVISGHRGLASARLFTDIDKLEKGDTFIVNVLDEVMTYEVDQIMIVLPYELDELSIVDGKDYVTLVTCTPYGINTHRLLVRGHRIENAKEVKKIRVSADAVQLEPVTIAPFVAAPILLIFALWVFISPSGSKKKSKKINPKE